MASSTTGDFKPRRSSREEPWTRAEAEQALADAGARGVTLYAYARQYGLRNQDLYRWRSRLQRRDSTADGAGGELGFVRVVATEPAAATRSGCSAQQQDSGIEMAVGPVTVRLTRSYCDATLRRLLPAVLEAVSC